MCVSANLHMSKLGISIPILPQQRTPLLLNVCAVCAFYIHVHNGPRELHPGRVEGREHHLPPAGGGVCVCVWHFEEEAVFGPEAQVVHLAEALFEGLAFHACVCVCMCVCVCVWG